MNGRVLSIQSHVVYGYCGNKSATFPLQLHGFHVDAINTVQYSNHTQYKSVTGQVLKPDELTHLVQGLTGNEMIQDYTHILTGYCNSSVLLQQIKNVVLKVKQANPKAMYVCDPVMGDEGRMYVPDDILPFVREHIVPLADVLTPNQFEAEILTGIQITDESSAVQAIDQLHSMGVKIVLISSASFASKDYITSIMSRVLTDGSKQRFKCDMEKIPFSFVGTGDLTSALILSWLTRTNNDIQVTLSNTMSTIKRVLDRTYLHYKKQGDSVSYRHQEIHVIEAKEDIEHPPSIISVVPI